MQLSRAYRKKMSLIEFGGATYRLTAAFLADLSFVLSAAVNQPPTDTIPVQSADGVETLTLAEVMDLQTAIYTQRSAALKEELI